MLQRYESVQHYYRERDRRILERRLGEERRKLVRECVRSIMDRRTGDRRGGVVE